MAMAWRRLLTLPALPPGPLLSSPCLNSCMTRPRVLRCRGDGLGMATSAVCWVFLRQRRSHCAVPTADMLRRGAVDLRRGAVDLRRGAVERLDLAVRDLML